MSGRVASLDLLRGAAAFSVAVPHYLTLNSAGWPAAGAVAIAAVEVFFVLSGFVLASQIVCMVMGNPASNLGVFLVRRWMRTIPPFLVALLVVSLITAQTGTGDFYRYAGYIQNLLFQANRYDYFPVAWSLAVEEWFYVTFAPLLFLLAWAFKRQDRKFAAAYAIAFIVAITVLRVMFGPGNWDAEVRRVTIFRLDSIAWGFLLFLAVEKRAVLDLRSIRSRVGLLSYAALLAGFAAAAGWTAYSTTTNEFAKQVFPFAAGGLGLTAVAFFRQAEPVFAAPAVRRACIYLGQISYPVYLFHMILAMVLKPRLAGLDLPAQLLIYILALLALTTAFHAYFEKPILNSRPQYGGASRWRLVLAPPALPARIFPSRWVAGAVIVAACLAFFVCRLGYNANSAVLFYASLLALALILAAVARKTRLSASSAVLTAANTFVLFAIVLPAADYIFRPAQAGAADPAKPAYSFTAAKTDPQAFSAWWAYYVHEWTRKDGGKAATQGPDPIGKLPFVLKPGSSGQFFDSVIRVNNFGFRGRDMAKDKGGAYRIFALGESPTFGPTLHPNDRPWPEMLQSLIDERLSCERPVEVINAGTEAYNLQHNLERIRRDVIPLKPDLVLSYHGYNGLRVFGLLRAPARPQRNQRASPLLGEVEYQFNLARSLQQYERAAATTRASEEPRSQYAGLYRELIRLGRENSFRVVLGTSSMAVNGSSPQEVKDFYGAVFSPIDAIIEANAEHNEIVRRVAEKESVHLIETTAALDGIWDEDLYLDIVHFTESGNERLASAIFEGLVAILGAEGPRCALKRGKLARG